MKSNVSISKDFWATLFALDINPNTVAELSKEIIFKNTESFALNTGFKKIACPVILDSLQINDSKHEQEAYQNAEGLIVTWIREEGLLGLSFKGKHLVNNDSKKNYTWERI